jgi:HlyD family secretion protein
VKKGEVVAEFDPQQMRDHLDDTIAGYRQQENDVKKQVAQNELDLENYRQTLLVARAALDKAKLDLKAADVRSAIDAEILKLRVEEAQATYKQIADNMGLKEASERAALRYDEIGLYKEKLHVQRHQEDLDRLVVRAPMDGMVILGAMQRPTGDQATYEVGDRVRPGQPFMKIVDPKALQLEGEINQAESSSFRIGHTAKIGLDAYPKSRLQGKVYSIGALAVGGRRQQYFIRSIPIKIQIENPTAGVIPDLTGHADILLASDENALLVPSSAVEHEKEGDFVYVQTPQGFQKRHVTLAGTNGTESMIEAGVSEGDVIRSN